MFVSAGLELGLSAVADDLVQCDGFVVEQGCPLRFGVVADTVLKGVHPGRPAPPISEAQKTVFGCEVADSERNSACETRAKS